MARQPGSRVQMAFAFESVYGTPPATGYRRMPFIAPTSMMAEQGLIAGDIMGFGRDPAAPTRDAIGVSGQATVPLDTEALGFWLKAIFGQPTTTGTTPRTHTFQSGGFVLPSFAMEMQYPDVPRFAMYGGCVADSIRWTMQRSGLVNAQVAIVGRSETNPGATAAGTLAEFSNPLPRFTAFQGAIQRNGAALGLVESCEIAYANNLDRVETIRGDGLIEAVDPGMASLTGSIEVRFSDLVLLNQAIAGDPCELIFDYQISASLSFRLTAHAVYLPRPRIQVDGPNGIRAAFDWQAARAAAPNRLCTAVLVNAFTGY